MSKMRPRFIDMNDPNQRAPGRATPPPTMAPVWEAVIPQKTLVEAPDALYAPGAVTVRCYRPDIAPPPPPELVANLPPADWVNVTEASQIMGVSKAYFAILAKKHKFERKRIKGVSPRKGEPMVFYKRDELEQYRATLKRRR